MTAYAAPLADLRFVLEDIVGLKELARLPGCEEATPDLVAAVLEEAGKLASEVLAPLNQPGDQAGSVFENGVVRTPPGFAEAYRQFAEGGWNAVPFDPDYGGQGLPWAVAMALAELWQGANLSFGLCPLLTQGAVELLQAHGTAAQKATFLPKMISGEWTGTMNLTEPQAGSDVGALKTRAVRDGDHYRITGQKIYITWGEHDCAENIIHMVLARLPDAPPGTRGISLFLVPKLLVREDGSLGPRNDLRCVSIEHKLGIRASPTAVMAYGDNEGAVGFLVGEESQGMACMFTMMNNARLAVGVQGVAICDRATQQAIAFAKQRVQSRAIDGSEAPVAIVNHPDVRRMLMTMRASTEAARALGLTVAGALDRAKRHPDPDERRRYQDLVEVLTPVAKAWPTDLAVEVASLGVQVHGGMGYIEETGAAQHYRDARILPIYEGTNGIQAVDLLFRKLARDRGRMVGAVLGGFEAEAAALEGGRPKALAGIGPALVEALRQLRRATDWLVETCGTAPELAAAGASPYLRLFGIVVGGCLLARGTAAAGVAPGGAGNGVDRSFLRRKQATLRFYADNLLPQAEALRKTVVGGGASSLGIDPADL